jgi:hypothetical protein
VTVKEKVENLRRILKINSADGTFLLGSPGFVQFDRKIRSRRIRIAFCGKM